MPGQDACTPCTAGTPAARSGPVKWFDPDRGFGFVLVGRRGRDAFLHMSVLRRDGFGPVAQGDRVTCTVSDGERGLTVVRVLAVERAAMDDGSTGQPPVQVVGWVKFYSLSRGYGFVRDAEGREVFVGSKLLRRLGVAPLRPDQAVRLTAVPGERGLVAETLTFLG